jgi:tRNA (adenine57-N1/adenine58-N1)-methyltransferase
MSLIQEGDDVLLYLDKKRTYLVNVKDGKQFHTHKGFLGLGELIGKPFGSTATSSLGVTFHVLKPLIRDRIMKTERRTQVLYPKDIGFLLFQLDIGSGSRVVEAGTGSGALTMALANAVRPNGMVYTYEINPKFQNIASRNIERAGLSEFVELIEGDITEGIAEKEIDAIVLDLATPWVIVPMVSRTLKGGGVFASFSPTIEQVVKTVAILKEQPFVDVETIELILKRWAKTDKQATLDRHSGYITTARKII